MVPTYKKVSTLDVSTDNDERQAAMIFFPLIDPVKRVNGYEQLLESNEVVLAQPIKRHELS